MLMFDVIVLRAVMRMRAFTGSAMQVVAIMRRVVLMPFGQDPTDHMTPT
jgi:hypothetical protein